MRFFRSALRASLSRNHSDAAASAITILSRRRHHNAKARRHSIPNNGYRIKKPAVKLITAAGFTSPSWQNSWLTQSPSWTNALEFAFFKTGWAISLSLL